MKVLIFFSDVSEEDLPIEGFQIFLESEWDELVLNMRKYFKVNGNHTEFFNDYQQNEYGSFELFFNTFKVEELTEAQSIALTEIGLDSYGVFPDMSQFSYYEDEIDEDEEEGD